MRRRHPAQRVHNRVVVRRNDGHAGSLQCFVWLMYEQPLQVGQFRLDVAAVGAGQPGEALQGAGVAIVSSSDQTVLDALLATPPRHLIDLTGRLGSEVEALSGYEGLGW